MFAFVRSLLITRLFGGSRLDAHRFSARLRAVLEPRKPRHRALRFVLGVVGVALLAVLVAVAIVVGAAMLTVGLGYRLLRGSARPAVRDPRIVEAEYSVVARPALPLVR
jgi:hypothetical protein